ncbi:hypothetical protein GF340_04550 [Candidatus Peregrinibacteria bacterium]|nr:hypothetical protein [Candidatus Peregrinibacteria bacterium]
MSLNKQISFEREVEDCEDSGLRSNFKTLNKGEKLKIQGDELLDSDLGVVSTTGEALGRLVYNFVNNEGYGSFSFIFPNDYEVLLPFPNSFGLEDSSEEYVTYEIGRNNFRNCFNGVKGVDSDHIIIKIYFDDSVEIKANGKKNGLALRLVNRETMKPNAENACIVPVIGGNKEARGSVSGRKFSISTWSVLGDGRDKINNEDSFAFNEANKRLVICDGISNGVSSEFAALAGAKVLANTKGGLNEAIFSSAEALETLNYFYRKKLQKFYNGGTIQSANLSNAVHGVIEFIDKNHINFNHSGDVRLKVISDGKIFFENTVINAVFHYMVADEMSAREALECALEEGTLNVVYDSLVEMYDKNKRRIVSNLFIPDDALLVMYSDGYDLSNEELINCVAGKNVEEARKDIELSQKLMNIGGVKTCSFNDGYADFLMPAPRDNSTVVVVGPAEE